MAPMASSAPVNGSPPAALASEATSPVSHCISAMPRNIAMVNSDSARPRISAG